MTSESMNYAQARTRAETIVGFNDRPSSLQERQTMDWQIYVGKTGCFAASAVLLLPMRSASTLVLLFRLGHALACCWVLMDNLTIYFGFKRGRWLSRFTHWTLVAHTLTALVVAVGALLPPESGGPPLSLPPVMVGTT